MTFQETSPPVAEPNTQFISIDIILYKYITMLHIIIFIIILVKSQ